MDGGQRFDPVGVRDVGERAHHEGHEIEALLRKRDGRVPARGGAHVGHPAGELSARRERVEPGVALQTLLDLVDPSKMAVLAVPVRAIGNRVGELVGR
ncbi:hypothetical protein [Micromonospora wenchangensis]|uniref:hypothetical protein n=1 Tax=Micromonospora wenchangensis TaxID=1185415 RepID=UPI003D73B59D